MCAWHHVIRLKMFINQFITILCLFQLVGIITAFEFLESPVNTTGVEGGIVLLPCHIARNTRGNGPSSSYWTRTRDNHIISENNDTNKFARLNRDLAPRLSILGQVSYEYNLQISNLTVEDAGFYQCWHLDENEYGHYSKKAYLSVLPKDTAAWFPFCTVDSSSNFGGVGRTVGSTLTYNCQPPSNVQLPNELSLYVRSIHSGDKGVPITSCDHVPCSFSYTLRLTDRNSRFVCGTEINRDIFEEECTMNQLRERNEISLSPMPKVFLLNSVGKLFCESVDDGEEYQYQWFMEERPLTELESENYYTFFISQNLNNTEITCVVNDMNGYVGSSSIVIDVTVATSDKDSDPRQNGKDKSTEPPHAPVQDKSHTMEKIFGIPIEILLFLSCAIVVLLLLLIIFILLLQRQKRSRQEHGNIMHHSELVAIGNAELKVDLSNDVIISSHTKHHATSPRVSESEDASFYDNVPSGDEYSYKCHSRPYNSNNAKGMLSYETAGRSSVSAKMAITEFTEVTRSDYNVLDPYIASDNDTLDSFDLEDMRERSQRNFENERTDCLGQTSSTKSKPSCYPSQSIVTRQSSLPVNSPSALYAVTSLISHGDGRRSVSALSRVKQSESAPLRSRSVSCQSTRAEYASPCNRPKSKDFSLSSNKNSDCEENGATFSATEEVDGVTGHKDVDSSAVGGEYAEITGSPQPGISQKISTHSHPDRSRTSDATEGNIIRLERIDDGTEQVLMLDDNKYITNNRILNDDAGEI